MRITVHVNGFYDWEPVPADVQIYADNKPPAPGEKPKFAPDFQRAIDQKRAKPDLGGRWLMRVTKKADTYTDVALPESEIIGVQIQEMCRGDKRPMTRLECASRYLARFVFDHHTHKQWMEEFEVHDDGPNEAMFSAAVAEHVAAGNIAQEDVPELLAAYLKPVAEGAHVEHFHNHFGVKPEAHARSKARRAAKGASQ